MTSLFLVDDDPDFIALSATCLSTSGFSVESTTSSSDAIESIQANAPDCVIVDLMMPDVNGLQLCQQIKSSPALQGTKVIVVTSKSYESDRQQAISAGVDGYITKPIKPSEFAKQVSKIISDNVEIVFWGTRGTVPVPGPDTVRYGGNTSCVSVETNNRCLYVFDAGTGIRRLSDYLVSRESGQMGKILISHTHMDHIQSLPFFAPLFVTGNEFAIMGGAPPNVPLRQIISTQMQSEYFPIALKEFSARVYFEELSEGTYQHDSATVKTMLLNHPGFCLGYRLEYGSASVCYVTDNELFLKNDRRYNPAYVKNLTQFVQNADVLITDCTYTDEEYLSKVGWGHSCVSEVVKLANDANVKSLYLHHHDVSQTDDDVDRKLANARQQLKKLGSATQCFAPVEGERISIPSHRPDLVAS